MRRLHLEFLMAFSKMEGQSKTLSTTINEAAQYLNDIDYMLFYVQAYKIIAHYDIIPDVKKLIKCGYTFKDACIICDICS